MHAGTANLATLRTRERVFQECSGFSFATKVFSALRPRLCNDYLKSCFFSYCLFNFIVRHVFQNRIQNGLINAHQWRNRTHLCSKLAHGLVNKLFMSNEEVLKLFSSVREFYKPIPGFQ